jgi:hypothetical protein
MKKKWLLSKLSKQLKMPFLKTKQNCVNPITSIPYTICHKADKGKRNLILGGKPFLKKKKVFTSPIPSNRRENDYPKDLM